MKMKLTMREERLLEALRKIRKEAKKSNANPDKIYEIACGILEYEGEIT